MTSPYRTGSILCGYAEGSSICRLPHGHDGKHDTCVPPSSPLRWIFGRHTLKVWKVELESTKAIKVWLTTAARDAPSMWIHVPYSVDALVDLSKLVGEGFVDVEISEGTKT